jgi:hypothetical protein
MAPLHRPLARKSLVIALAGALGAPLVHAQGALEEVLVTAQRRQENI